jgi:hypothetical protein
VKSTKDHEFDMNISARTEHGRVAIDLGLDHLNAAQREFIFSSMAGTLKGGSTGFGMKTLETGEIILEITLSGPNLRKPVNKAIKALIRH